MNFNLFEYYENEELSFKAKESSFLSFLGEKNSNIVDNLMFKKENNFITLNNTKITKNNIYKLRKEVGFASYRMLNTFLTETVYYELAFPLESLAKTKDEIRELIDEYVRLYKLEDIINKSPKYLSTGEKAKLIIASALITKPNILVLDNILSSLDELDRKLVLRNLKEFIMKGGIILNFTREIEETLLSSEIIITDKEKIILSGSTISVLNEEKIMKRLGYDLPFIFLLNKYLKDYGLVKKYLLEYDKLVGAIWK